MRRPLLRTGQMKGIPAFVVQAFGFVVAAGAVSSIRPELQVLCGLSLPALTLGRPGLLSEAGLFPQGGKGRKDRG